VIVVDTGVLYAYFDADDPHQAEAAALLEASDEVCIVSPFVVAELDYFVLSRFGLDAEVSMLEELLDGAYELPPITRLDVAACSAVVTRYADKRIGITDASLVVLADRYRTNRIASYDRRHFTTMRGLDGRPFELLP
jgi:predicted nucleic acid-binding protein